jgi:hypothetical protein
VTTVNGIVNMGLLFSKAEVRLLMMGSFNNDYNSQIFRNPIIISRTKNDDLLKKE